MKKDGFLYHIKSSVCVCVGSLIAGVFSMFLLPDPSGVLLLLVIVFGIGLYRLMLLVFQRISFDVTEHNSPDKLEELLCYLKLMK